MGDKPIIFSAPMVRALLAGTKTQTRRVMEPQPNADAWGGGPALHYPVEDGWMPIRYAIGDRLWVRESHFLTDDGDYETVVYAENEEWSRAHLEGIRRMQIDHGLSDEWAKPHLRLRPSIHMPRWASRLTLTVTGVRVRRLQDISDADAVAEGIPADFLEHIHGPGGYRDLWNSLHGPTAWDANPWVVAVSFTVAKGNIDDTGANNE